MSSKKPSIPHRRRRPPLAAKPGLSSPAPLKESEITHFRSADQADDSPPIKSSELLMEFIEPFRVENETEEVLKRLLGLGSLAWNLANAPQDEREQKIKQAVSRFGGTVLDDASRERLQEMEHSLRVLIQHKLTLYSQYTFYVVDYTLTEYQDSWNLAVAIVHRPPQEP